jgi:hypothetical protein
MTRPRAISSRPDGVEGAKPMTGKRRERPAPGTAAGPDGPSRSTWARPEEGDHDR